MKKILILTANPLNTDKLRLDEEVREIQAGLERSQRRDRFEVVTRWALRVDDLRRTLLDHEPQIVHFSGHGAREHGLALENSSGKLQLVSNNSLVRLFKLFKNTIECVLLNACYSEAQAEAIYQHIDYVVGMNKVIGDRAAIEFAVGFYDALGAGRSYADAYEFGCSAIDLEGISESLTPVLKSRTEVELANNNLRSIASVTEAESLIPVLKSRTKLEPSADSRFTQTEVIPPVEPRELYLNLLQVLMPSQFENIVFKYGVDSAHLSFGTPQAQRAIEVVRYAEQQEGATLTKLSRVIYEVVPHLKR
ncbi:MAG: CHAT domain-containing protein [Coleofasciculaceae cyanobacterium]